MTIKTNLPVDRNKAVTAYREFLRALGYDPTTIPSMCDGPSGKDTAQRAADAYLEFLAKGEAESVSFTTFPASKTQGMVVLTNIEFYSLCAHHMLPYYGVVHVGYVPKGKVCGLSKLARVVDHYAYRPSIQEDLTSKIATFVMEQLEPHGCGVVIEATHLCMAMRGVEKSNHLTITSDARDSFQQTTVSNEFHSLVRQAKHG